MAASASPAAALSASRRDAARFAEKVGASRLRSVLVTAQADLEKRLKEAIEVGPGAESFTVAQIQATLEQVRHVIAGMKMGVTGVVFDTAKAAGSSAAKTALAYLEVADQKFRGVGTARLSLNTARIYERAASGTESSILHRLVSDPTRKGHAGVMDRYGTAVVGYFEDVLQQRMIAKQPWEVARRALVEESPFLRGAPGHWAERILRTETMHAHARSTLETTIAANDELGDMVKIIVSTFDDRTAADSYAEHGQIRRPSEAFDTWYGPMMHPPDRPNDRAIVVPHRISWPIPDELAWRSDSEVSAAWVRDGRKGSPPGRPKMTTVDLDLFGKEEPPAQAQVPEQLTPATPKPLGFGELPQPTAEQAQKSGMSPHMVSVFQKMAESVASKAELAQLEQAPVVSRAEELPVPPEYARTIRNYTALKIGEQGGSNPGGFYRGTDGTDRYVKFYESPAQGMGEHIANQIYADLGLGRVRSTFLPDVAGALPPEARGRGTFYASEVIPGAKQLGEDVTKMQASKALDGFVADVLTGNWDAAGLNIDNLVQDEDGQIYRIDNGGTFLTRAQGARKPEKLLDEIGEWDTLFDPEVNPAYAKLAKTAGVEKAEDLGDRLERQIKKVLEVRDQYGKSMGIGKTGTWKNYVLQRVHGAIGTMQGTEEFNRIVQMLDARTAKLEAKLAEIRRAKEEPEEMAAPAGTGKKVAEAREMSEDELKAQSTHRAEGTTKQRLGEDQSDHVFNMRSDGEWGDADEQAIEHWTAGSYQFIRFLDQHPGLSREEVGKAYAAERVAYEKKRMARAGIESEPDLAYYEKIGVTQYDEIHEHAEHLPETLDKLQPTGVQPLYRGISFEFEDDWERVAKQAEAAEFDLAGTASASVDAAEAIGFATNKFRILYRIKTKSGRYVDPLSAAPGEFEAVVPNGVKFRATGFSKNVRTAPGGQTITTLFIDGEEVGI